MGMKEKVSYLDGLRGVAALVVVLTHYKLMLYPRYPDVRFQQLGAMQHAPYEFLLEKLPLMILFTGGNLAVLIFFVHSGFVLSYKFAQNGDYRVLLSMAARRVFRLGIPVAAAVFFAYGIARCGLMRNVELAPVSGSQWWLGIFYTFHPSLTTALPDALGGVILRGETRYNGVFWTMAVELICSYLLFCALPLLVRCNRYLLLGLLAALFVATPSLPVMSIFAQYVVYFLAGIVFCIFFVHTDLFAVKIPQMLDRFRWVRPCLLLLAIIPWLYMSTIQWAIRAVFGQKPIVGAVSAAPVARLLSWLTVGQQYQRGWLEIGSSLLIVALVLTHRPTQRWLNTRALQHLGRLSFSVYLVHLPILASFSSWLFLTLSRAGFRYNIAAVVTYAVSLPLVYAVAALMARSVDRFAINFGKATLHRLFFQPRPVRGWQEQSD